MNLECLLLTSFARDIVIFFSHQELLSHLRTKGPRQQQTENIFQLQKENRFFFLVTNVKVSQLITNLRVWRVG